MPIPLKDHPKGAPGSDTARKHGCRCPVLDNNHGAGMYVDSDGQAIYAVSGNCEIHNNYTDCMPIHTDTTPEEP